MTTQSIPHLRRNTVAETAKKTSSDKPAEQAAKPAAAPKLAPAGASGDAGVQNLLAQRNGYDVNGMTDKVAEVDRQLAELGYTV